MIILLCISSNNLYQFIFTFCIFLVIFRILFVLHFFKSFKLKKKIWRNNMKTDKKEPGSELAYAALDDVPTPKSDAKEIVGLVKSGGRISGYQLSDGTTVSKEEGYRQSAVKS